MMQDRRGRGDRVAAEEHLHAGKLRPRDEPVRDRLGAGDGAVEPRLRRGGRDMMLLERRRQFGRLAIGMARVERGNIGLGQLRRLGELGLEPVNDRLARTIEHPEREPKRPHILAAERFLVAKAERLHRIHRQLGDVERQKLPLRQRPVGQRRHIITCLGEIARAELTLIGDDQAAGLERSDIRLERRRVHRDQHVGLVARRLDGGRSEVDLECRDAEQRPLRRPDLRRKIREGRQVVPCQCRGQRELPARQLHAVATVTRKAYDYRFCCWMR